MVVALDSLHAAVSGISAVAIHLEGHMLRDATLLQGTDEKVSQLAEDPFSGRGLDRQSAQDATGARHGCC